MSQRKQDALKRISRYHDNRERRLAVASLRLYDDDRAVAELEKQGMVPLTWGETPTFIQIRLEAAINKCWMWIKPHWDGSYLKLKHIYAFCPGDQAEDLYGIQHYLPGNEDCTIGISTFIIKSGDNQLTETLLHELAHLTVYEHDVNFVHHLNRLLYQYNEKYGTNIKNSLSELGIYVDEDGHYSHYPDGKPFTTN